MTEVRQALDLDAEWPAFGALAWLREWLSSLNALFDSWKGDCNDDDVLGLADPELVAALRYVASLLSNQAGGEETSGE